ncbi:hypothetical protein G6F49_011365 [Rhizopus delemar]|nr:hypothetical protein G6F49_011365 [Rhizopus delemar]
MKTPIDYFFQTASKEWRILEAISVYDKLKRYDSFGSLLEAMQRDIGSACEKQPTFKKKGKLFVEIVEGSGNEGQDSDHNNADIDIRPPTTVRIDKIADTITNHGELNVVNNKVPLLPYSYSKTMPPLDARKRAYLKKHRFEDCLNRKPM